MSKIIANKKGILGILLIFVAVVVLVSGFVYAVYVVGSQTAAELMYRDELSSFSLVSDAVVNSPGCLLYTEERTVAGEKTLVANRGVIDWDKVSDSAKGCVRKGPYVWNATANDETEKQEKSINNYGSECKELAKKSFPVIIKRKDKFDKGTVEVSVASRDAIATYKKDGQVFEIAILNTGTCSSAYNLAVSIVNSTSDEQSGIQVYRGIPPLTTEMQKFTDTTPVLRVNTTAITKVSVPDKELGGYSLKIEISPKDIAYYTKVYRTKL